MASNPNEVISKTQARKGAAEQKEGAEAQAEESKGGASRFRTMKGMIAGLAVISALAGASLASCTEDSKGLPQASGCTADGGCTDASTDSDTTTDSDTSTDSGTDTDTSTDSGTDTETTTDSGTDTDLDGGSDGGADAGPLLCTEGLAGADESLTDLFSVGEPKSVGGYGFEFLGISGLNARFRITCGGAEVEANKLCPVGAWTTFTTAEGRDVSIRPITAGAENSQSTVSVD
ncbi:hypothetical protein L0Y65_06920 [Candidatus Micrarchaeota archaeon]|nr:hypothetical protein [Candidatus Micrarchaeota archaeon]